MYPILVALVAVIATYRGYRRFRARELTGKMLMVWVVLWVGVTVVSFVPWVADRITGLVGIGRGVDLVFFSAILLLLYLMFHLFIRLEASQQELTRLVRALALRDFAAEQAGKQGGQEAAGEAPVPPALPPAGGQAPQQVGDCPGGSTPPPQDVAPGGN